MFTEDNRIQQAVTTANGATGTAAINGTALDTVGYNGGCCIVTFGPITAGAVTSIKLQQSSDNGGDDDYTDVAGTSQTVADDADNTVFVIDFTRSTKRYVRLVVSRATQAATVGAATYIQYGARSMPVTQPAGINVERFHAAVEGTA
jgi:hypothetical protein